MSWRFGLTVRKLPDGRDYYEVRELFEGPKGVWASWTEHPVPAQGESRAEVIRELEMMLEDCKKFKAKRIPTPPKQEVEK